MINHPKREDIIEALLDNSKGQDDISIRKHLLECPECRAFARSIEKISEASENDAVVPNDNLLVKIIKARNEMEEGKEFNFTGPRSQIRFLKPLLAASVLIFFMITALYIKKNDILEQNLAVSINNVKGGVYVNMKPVHQETALEQGGILDTEKDSSVNLFLDKVFSIRVDSNSRLSLKKALNSRISGQMVFLFGLEQGMLYSNFRHNTGLSYSFITPNARVDAIGTEFSLRTAPGKTNIVLLQGKIRITCLLSGKRLETSERKEYIITDSIEENEAEGAAKNELNGKIHGKKQEIIDSSDKGNEDKEKIEEEKKSDDTAGERERERFRNEIRNKENRSELKDIKRSIKKSSNEIRRESGRRNLR